MSTQAEESEDRAKEYRRMMQAREDNRALLEQRLYGDKEALRQLHEDYDPLIPDRIGWDPYRKVVASAEDEDGRI